MKIEIVIRKSPDDDYLASQTELITTMNANLVTLNGVMQRIETKLDNLSLTPAQAEELKAELTASVDTLTSLQS